MCRMPMSGVGQRLVASFYEKFRCFIASYGEEIYINLHLTDFKSALRYDDKQWYLSSVKPKKHQTEAVNKS